MKLFFQPMLSPLMLMFLSCSFWTGGSIQCGGNQIAYTVIVDQNGKGKFPTVQAAIDSVEKNNNKWVKVRINAGTYIEKVQISFHKPCIILEGAGKDITSITFHSNRPTFVSSPPNVVVIGISFKRFETENQKQAVT
ncbi:probable pectinesterase 29 [Abrus precatorius]|uniref:pectinesterase n=1 Tax=Abrus precatorius TaxID=3816 RepID=A0A8B8ML14_ABRPR|nr:probable pectinesterase 29 [Abrus precatorius]